jgi:hypothetical protein
MPVPCTPANTTALNITQSCDNTWAANNDDCNKFVKAALGSFLAAAYFDGLNADGIVGKMKTAAEGWTMTTAIADAIGGAKDGKVVIAGMTSAELGDTHGHLAVVVGCDGQVSGTVTVPVGYAGALNPIARLDGGRLSGTFQAEMVRSEGINYFIKAAVTA